MRLPLTAFAWVFAAVACTPDLSEPHFGDQALPDASGNTNLDAGDSNVDFSDMTGTWALMTDESVCVRVFANEETRAYTILRVEVVQDGLRLHETMTTCSVVTTPVINVETLIPGAVVEAAGEIEVESRLYGTRPGATYDGGIIAQVWGIRLEDPINDPFPRAEELPDERIFDADEDGNEGVTLKLGGDFCDLYVVQRSLSSLFGILQPDGTIDGASGVVTEQTVLGASNSFCATSFETNPNDGDSKAQMVRVDERGRNLDQDGDGHVSCAEIVAHQNALVTWTRPDNIRCE